MRWLLAAGALVAFLHSARDTYVAFDCAWVAVCALVVVRVGSRY